jgi:hypothetical protein
MVLNPARAAGPYEATISQQTGWQHTERAGLAARQYSQSEGALVPEQQARSLRRRSAFRASSHGICWAADRGLASAVFPVAARIVRDGGDRAAGPFASVGGVRSAPAVLMTCPRWQAAVAAVIPALSAMTTAHSVRRVAPEGSAPMAAAPSRRSQRWPIRQTS